MIMIDYVCGCVRALSSSYVLKFEELEVVQICDDHAVVI